MKERLAEKYSGLIQLLVRQRQVCKTTLLLEIASEWAGRSVYASADTLEAALPNWRKGIWRRIEALARDGSPTVLLLDEVQYLPDWSLWLKANLMRFSGLGRVGNAGQVAGSNLQHLNKDHAYRGRAVVLLRVRLSKECRVYTMSPEKEILKSANKYCNIQQ